MQRALTQLDIYLGVYKNGTSGEIMIEPQPYNRIEIAVVVKKQQIARD